MDPLLVSLLGWHHLFSLPQYLVLLMFLEQIYSLNALELARKVESYYAFITLNFAHLEVQKSEFFERSELAFFQLEEAQMKDGTMALHGVDTIP